MTKTYQAIPTNLITGFLGSGKTTVILELLKSRPAGSRWAVLVNEFGDVGIDGSLLEQSSAGQDVFIKEVPGGCICCAAGLPLQMALNLLIKQAEPERILIEPTGVGHPRRIMDTLTGDFYRSVLDLRATVCLVEAGKLSQSDYINNETFIDQINIADVLLASKADLASEEQLDDFHRFSTQFEIPKAYTDSIEHGKIANELLDLPRNPERSISFPDAHAVSKHQHAAEHHEVIEQGAECDWRRFENTGQGYFSCGWVFNKSILFNSALLEQLINHNDFACIKGVFHTEKGWLIFNRAEQQFSIHGGSQQADSRVEFIENRHQDWNRVENDLLNCIDHF
jgi:G3E family GTPase